MVARSRLCSWLRSWSSTLQQCMARDTRCRMARRNPKSIGEHSEGQIISAFFRAGKVVLLPFGDNQRYDLVVDEDGQFLRIQCKTGRVKDGCVQFSTCSTNFRSSQRYDYRGQADVFAVYVPPPLDRVYVVPVSDVCRSVAVLRLRPPQNSQVNRIKMASDYEFGVDARLVRKAQPQPQVMPPGSPPSPGIALKHGTVHTYNRLGCRCDECREANRLHSASGRIRAKRVP